MLRSFENKLYTAGALCFRPFLSHLLADTSNENVDVSQLNHEEIIEDLNYPEEKKEKLFLLKDEVNDINHSLAKGNIDLSKKIVREVIKLLNYFF